MSSKRSSKKVGSPASKVSFLESARASTASAVPLVANSSSSPSKVVVNFLENHVYLKKGHREKVPRVGLFTLLSFATASEIRWMIFGAVNAFISGLSMPAWLLLLGQSLETFNSIGKLVNTIGGEATLDLLLSELYRLCWLFAVVGGVSLVVGSAYVGIWTYTGEKQALRIREKFVRAAFQQDLSWFDRRGDPQELPTFAANALTKIGDSLGRQMMDTMANLISAVGCLMVAIGLNAPLALIMLCVLPIIAIIIGIISVFLRRRSGQALDCFASAGAFATEVISSIKTVASLNAQLWAAKRYEAMVRRGQKYSIWAGFLTRVSAGVMGMIFYGTYTVSFILGTEQVANTEEVGEGKLNPFYCLINYCGISGSEVMVCIYGIILTAQFFALMNPGIQAVNFGRQAAVEIFGTINRKPDIDASTDTEGLTLSDYDGSLEFRDVAFAYPSRPESLIFRSFNLKIAAGSSVALVGPSGSGKSTISKLLLRFYDPLAGEVLAQGKSLKDINVKSWRSHIGYVPQEPVLLVGTIRQNIAMGFNGGNVTQEMVETAARAASAHDFILELPDGYDTFYNGASLQLSGGQVQRIAIARAMIRRPKVLILDEATSALDTQSEKVVQQALASLRRTEKITTVSVAHRLATIVTSDQIAVIDNGSIQQLGDHATLLADGGVYGLLCKAQGITAETALKIAQEESACLVDDKGKPPPEEALGSTLVEDDIENGGAKDLDVKTTTVQELASLSRLWQYNRDEVGYLAMGIVGAVIVGALAPLEGILFSQLTANFFELESASMREENRPLAYYFLILAAAAFLGNAAIGCGFSVAGSRLARRMRTAVFERIVRHGIGWFDFPENSTGNLTTSLEEECEEVSRLTGYALGAQIQVFSSLCVGLIVSMVYAWQIGLIALACVPLILGSGFVLAICLKVEVVDADGISPATILEQGLRNIALVQSYGLETNVGNQYCDSLVPDSQNKVKRGIQAGIAFGVSQCAIFGTFGLIFYAGVELMINLKISFTDFFASLLAIMFSTIAVGQTSADFSSNKKGLAAAARVFTIIDSPLDRDDPMSDEGQQPESISGAVEFKSVTFAYPTRPEQPVYHASDGHKNGFELSIPAATSVGFVGRSGCGKSTALQLLLRFYHASSGEVAVDGHNVLDLKLSWLRGNIGYVGQMPVLFSGSVRDNLLMGNREASEEDIIKACQQANAHEFITSLSNGYYTEIGPGGSLLSGGQKQRLAIARAIIQNPPILVLDEATSALDNESERVVQQALDDMNVTEPRTTLVVAHRLSTIKDCDQIAVLDDGGVVEYGSHDDLLAKKGIYAELWSHQAPSSEET